MDATDTTQFSVTCAPSCGVVIHPVPEGSTIQKLDSTTDPVTAAITYHYRYSNVSRLGIDVSGNGLYLIGAEVQ